MDLRRTLQSWPVRQLSGPDALGAVRQCSRRGALRSRLGSPPRIGSAPQQGPRSIRKPLGPPADRAEAPRTNGARRRKGGRGASARWCPTPSSPSTTDDRWSRPRRGPPTSPSTSFGRACRCIVAGGRRRALTDRPSLRRTERVGALVAISAGMVALVHDLGRPARFANMLRVAKPTSPMSMGTWILSVYGLAAGVAGLGELVRLVGAGATGEGRRGVTRVGGGAGGSGRSDCLGCWLPPTPWCCCPTRQRPRGTKVDGDPSPSLHVGRGSGRWPRLARGATCGVGPGSPHGDGRCADRGAHDPTHGALDGHHRRAAAHRARGQSSPPARPAPSSEQVLARCRHAGARSLGSRGSYCSPVRSAPVSAIFEAGQASARDPR